MFVGRRGRGESTTTILDAGELADLVERTLRTWGRRIDMSTPFVNAVTPCGSRLLLASPEKVRRGSAPRLAEGGDAPRRRDEQQAGAEAG